MDENDLRMSALAHHCPVLPMFVESYPRPQATRSQNLIAMKNIKRSAQSSLNVYCTIVASPLADEVNIFSLVQKLHIHWTIAHETSLWDLIIPPAPAPNPDALSLIASHRPSSILSEPNHQPWPSDDHSLRARSCWAVSLSFVLTTPN
jgi:hypothetical protein